MSQQDIDRRTFIAFGSAAIAGFATTGLRAQPAPGGIVSVGYRPFVTRGRNVGNAGSGSVYAASDVTFSEPSFMRTGARITIRGGVSRSSLALDVHHVAQDVKGKVVFHAWAPDSNPLSFTVPMELASTLDIEVTAGTTRQVIPFTVGSMEGALKLNPGKYIFIVSDRTPSWSALRMDKDELKMLDGRPAGFDYVIVSVSTPS